jgi:hypothetical protein
MKAATVVGLLLIVLGIIGLPWRDQLHPSEEGCGRGSCPTLAQRDQYYADLTDPEHHLVDRP